MRRFRIAALCDGHLASLRSEIRRRWRRISRPARLGTLRRTTPLSTIWGRDRGTPIGRYYIEKFLAMHQSDIHGHVLEIKDSRYTSRFGSNIVAVDILDLDAQNSRATIVADLADAQTIKSDQFDCFVLTQTLQYIYYLRDAIAHAYRILRPGGVLLVTVPGLRQIDAQAADRDYWRFTSSLCRSIFGEIFGDEQVAVQVYGNVLTTIAALEGMATEELSHRELDACDDYYPVIIAVRAVKIRASGGE